MEDLPVDVVDAAGVHLILEFRPQGRVLLGGEEEGGGIAAPGQSGPARQEIDGERPVTQGRAEPLREQRGHGTEVPWGGQGAPYFPTHPFPCPRTSASVLLPMPKPFRVQPGLPL